MRMRLVGETTTDVPGEKNWRLLETGELTLGRDPGCDWVLADPERRISKLHCRIRRDALGYLLTDESTNGVSVDGRDLVEKQTVRLANGATIAFCGQRFRVEITGEIEPDWTDPDARLVPDDDLPSITAILADVSPAGRGAASMLPGRMGDDWMTAVPRPDPRRPAEPSLSRTPVGWAGPPDASSFGSVIPEDWDAGSDQGSRSEHLPATSMRVRLPKAGGPVEERPVAASPVAAASADVLVDAFLRGLGSLASAPEDAAAFLNTMGHAMRTMRETLSRMRGEMRDFAAERHVDWRPAVGDADADGLAEAAEEEHARLLDTLRWLLGEVDDLDPSVIEARARVLGGAPHEGLVARLPLPGHAERRAWATYRASYSGKEGKPLGARFAERLGDVSGSPHEDEFVELSADRPRRGDAG